MKPFTFVPYDPSQAEEVLPRMFDILSGNMSAIAPTGRSNEEDRETWLAYMASEQGAARRVLLLYAGEDLAGYFQYGVEGDALCVDEIEISPAYQRTLLFYRFCRFAAGRLPEGVSRVRAYINKNNRNSQTIAGKLGMKAVGENKSGSSWLYEGPIEKLAAFAGGAHRKNL